MNLLGFTAKSITLNRQQTENPETVIRSKIQTEIKKLVEQRKSEAEIKETLNKVEEYKKYEEFLEEWIGNWIAKLNPKIRETLKKITRQSNLTFEDVKEEIKLKAPDIYELYEKEICKRIEEMLKVREAELKRIEEKKKEQER